MFAALLPHLGQSWEWALLRAFFTGSSAAALLSLSHLSTRSLTFVGCALFAVPRNERPETLGSMRIGVGGARPSGRSLELEPSIPLTRTATPITPKHSSAKSDGTGFEPSVPMAVRATVRSARTRAKKTSPIVVFEFFCI